MRADAPPILQEIANRWADERQHWSFTQLARETDGDGVVHERLERFDPSDGYEKRWRLLKIDGRAPTAEEISYWDKKKNKGRKKDPKNWLSYVDLDHAQLHGEDDKTLTYDVPMKRSAGGLFPGDKVSVRLTVDKQTRSIQHAQANVNEPFDVALGLAEVVDLDLNLQLPADKNAPNATAEAKAAQPQGKATAVVNKFGKRVEYTWSDFKRAGDG